MEKEDEQKIHVTFDVCMYAYVCVQKMELPLEGDDKAIKKYAENVEALKKKLGMPSFDALAKAEVQYAMAVAGNDVKKFVSSVMSDVDLSKTQYEGIGDEIMAAIRDVEKQTGMALDASNEKGWGIMASKVAELEKKYNLQDKSKVQQDAVFDMYKKHISAVKEKVHTEVGKLNDAEEITGSVNLSGLKPEVA